MPSLKAINRDEKTDKQLRADRKEYSIARKQAVDKLFEDARKTGWGGSYRDHPPDYINKNLDSGQPGPQSNARQQVEEMAEAAYGRKVSYEETPNKMVGAYGSKYEDMIRVTYAKKPPELYSETLGPKIDYQTWGEHQ